MAKEREELWKKRADQFSSKIPHFNQNDNENIHNFENPDQLSNQFSSEESQVDFYQSNNLKLKCCKIMLGRFSYSSETFDLIFNSNGSIRFNFKSKKNQDILVQIPPCSVVMCKIFREKCQINIEILDKHFKVVQNVLENIFDSYSKENRTPKNMTRITFSTCSMKFIEKLKSLLKDKLEIFIDTFDFDTTTLPPVYPPVYPPVFEPKRVKLHLEATDVNMDKIWCKIVTYNKFEIQDTAVFTISYGKFDIKMSNAFRLKIVKNITIPVNWIRECEIYQNSSNSQDKIGLIFMKIYLHEEFIDDVYQQFKSSGLSENSKNVKKRHSKIKIRILFYQPLSTYHAERLRTIILKDKLHVVNIASINEIGEFEPDSKIFGKNSSKLKIYNMTLRNYKLDKGINMNLFISPEYGILLTINDGVCDEIIEIGHEFSECRFDNRLNRLEIELNEPQNVLSKFLLAGSKFYFDSKDSKKVADSTFVLQLEGLSKEKLAFLNKNLDDKLVITESSKNLDISKKYKSKVAAIMKPKNLNSDLDSQNFAEELDFKDSNQMPSKISSKCKFICHHVTFGHFSLHENRVGSIRCGFFKDCVTFSLFPYFKNGNFRDLAKISIPYESIVKCEIFENFMTILPNSDFIPQILAQFSSAWAQMNPIENLDPRINAYFKLDKLDTSCITEMEKFLGDKLEIMIQNQQD